MGTKHVQSVKGNKALREETHKSECLYIIECHYVANKYLYIGIWKATERVIDGETKLALLFSA